MLLKKILQKVRLFIIVTTVSVGSSSISVASPTKTWQVINVQAKNTSSLHYLTTPPISTNENNFVLTQIPSPVRPTIPEPPKIPAPLPNENLLQTPSPSSPTPQTPPEIPEKIVIERLEFIGNTAFSNEELAKATEKFIGKPITFTELLQVEAIISRLYTDAGYINSGAVIPAQQRFSKDQAVVKVQIVEGGLEDIQVTGTSRLNPGYIKSRLAIAARKPLNRDRLLQAIQLLQLDPLIQNISAELSAGTSPELSLLKVTVKEADSLEGEFFVDNGRAPSVGSIRRGLRLSEGNLLGFGDKLRATYSNTDGSNSYDISYTVPINPQNGTVQLTYGASNTQVVEPPFDRLDILGNSESFELTLRQPLLQTPRQEFAIGLTFSQQQSKTSLLGLDFPISPGADDNGRTRISALRFFQEWTSRNSTEVFALRSQFNLGIGAFNATINDEPPDSRFFYWRGQGQYVRLLAPETLLVLRSDLQLTTRQLVPLEQFAIGGLGSVRGYRQDLLLTDNGAFLSAEVQLPILRVPEVQGILHLTPFVDFGIGWNSSANSELNSNTLLSTGLGLQWQMSDWLNMRLDWGLPLIDVDGSNNSLQENGLSFSVNVKSF
ncbi:MULTISPECIES: ShlB/FhaC/HecB family hemolysin secretion/activation protein [Nostoc]|uniref:ShlB/FhaC/HecB family hemolysin secretion/activation protein n=2 Tax=Nostoc TaxID=1177 RepID=A0ABR8I749_9NOSO|nr:MULTISPECIES: ShlB/FhaC/HecB family hemolysin secretion/activation protein [Nostoc]MBD2563812.1 ShlB/FhaC/HecB family hemolysin secretion/activation protein [Nostoc linckia FACHB-391]MBD2646746.1 ShlB/FhaC/HecB family hemolysin secretion/activation protein [Nostoc foliaceum FACHB-393]